MKCTYIETRQQLACRIKNFRWQQQAIYYRYFSPSTGAKGPFRMGHVSAEKQTTTTSMCDITLTLSPGSNTARTWPITLSIVCLLDACTSICLIFLTASPACSIILKRFLLIFSFRAPVVVWEVPFRSAKRTKLCMCFFYKRKKKA